MVMGSEMSYFCLNVQVNNQTDKTHCHQIRLKDKGISLDGNNTICGSWMCKLWLTSSMPSLQARALYFSKGLDKSANCLWQKIFFGIQVCSKIYFESIHFVRIWFSIESWFGIKTKASRNSIKMSIPLYSLAFLMILSKKIVRILVSSQIFWT